MTLVASEIEKASADLWRTARDLREGKCTPLEAIQRIGQAAVVAQSAAVSAAAQAQREAEQCDAQSCPIIHSVHLVRLRRVGRGELAAVG